MSRLKSLDLHRADGPARLLATIDELAAGLGVMGPPAAELVATTDPVGDLHHDGYVLVRNVGARATCAGLSVMIDRLLGEGLPAVFVVATDAALELAKRIEHVVSSAMGRPYLLVQDAWAWRIDPGSSGWPPHRGVTTPLDRDAPELLNTWLALSDVEVDRSCMHFVRLDDDAAYPTALDRVEVSGARPAPVGSGSLLFWNANILHWGGQCSPRAAGPRFSCSYSLERGGGGPPAGSSVSRALTPLERIDFIAGQIATYGEGQPDVSREILEWARASVALRALQASPPAGP